MNSKQLVFFAVGFELVGIVGGTLYLGHLVDVHFEWPGFAMVGLSLLGLVAWMFHIIYLLKKLEGP